MKNSLPKSLSKADKSPKTDFDQKFLDAVQKAKAISGIRSDRAMSMELGRHTDFINRVRNGFQSAPADAWDTLLNKYPAIVDAVGTINVTEHGGGQAVDTVQGNNFRVPATLEACQLELEQRKRDLAHLRAELEKAQQQVVDRDKLIASQEATIASKEEVISLLRGGYNRPA